MIATVDELAQYSGVHTDDDGKSATLYLQAASDILSSYLGYNPESAEYTKIFTGTGFQDIRAGVKPITALKSIKIDGAEKNTDDFLLFDDSIYFKAGVFPAGAKVLVEFQAGFDAEKIPAIMKMTVLRIAALLQLESDSNIGVSSRSFADSSRTFLNTVNYDKYLIQCSCYKLLY